MPIAVSPAGKADRVLPTAGLVVVPLVAGLATLWRAAASAHWQDDVELVRTLAFAPLGIDGLVSTPIAQLATLIPVGNHVFRASCVNALALAAAAAALYRLALVMVSGQGRVVLRVLLASAAALLVTLCPAWQSQATVARGSALGAGLVLLVISQLVVQPARISPVWLGVAVGATLAESRAAGLVLACSIAAYAAVRRELPTRKATLTGAASGAVVFALLAAPALLRTSYGIPGIEGGALLGGPEALNRALAGWIRELGIVQLGLAALGCVAAVRFGKLRPATAILGVFVMAGALLSAPTEVLSRTPRSELALLAVAALGCFAALGLLRAVEALDHKRLPYAHAAGTLLVVAQCATVLVTVEESAYQTRPREERAIESWTEEALGALPSRSMVLVRSRPRVFRLWVAQVVHGQRPDVTVVPMSLLETGKLANELARQEPATAALLRDLIVSGRASEFALTSLADARPLYVEPDPGWDPRLNQHLTPEAGWFRFTAHALGRSDRAQGIAEARQSRERILKAARSDLNGLEAATRALLVDQIEQERAVSLALSDKQAAQALLGELAELAPVTASAPSLSSSAPIERNQPVARR